MFICIYIYTYTYYIFKYVIYIYVIVYIYITISLLHLYIYIYMYVCALEFIEIANLFSSVSVDDAVEILQILGFFRDAGQVGLCQQFFHFVMGTHSKRDHTTRLI